MNEFIKPVELQQKINTGDAPLVLDVCTPDEFKQGHIPGAFNIPIDELSNRLSEIPKEQLIAPYCNMYHRGNSRGERVAQLLKNNGYEAHAVNGRFVEWNQSATTLTNIRRIAMQIDGVISSPLSSYFL